jgi:hypothetical protein
LGRLSGDEQRVVLQAEGLSANEADVTDRCGSNRTAPTA